jgi:taurine dioxygenase
MRTRQKVTATVKNLEAILGTEISGIDLSKPLEPGEVELIKETWRSRLVVVFREQDLSDPQLLDFSRNFGELDPPYGGMDVPRGDASNRPYPELTIISNVIENGVPIGGLGDGEAVWHADMTYLDVPPKAAMLYSLEVPPPEAGGNTYFANMFAAYDSLPNDLKKAAEGKVAVHDASTNSAGVLRKGYKRVTDVRETIGAQHLLVRTEPDTGRRALFLGRRPNSYVLGLEVSESEAVLDALWAHATKAALVMRHEWKVGDLLMWNNLSVLHRRDAFDPKARRVMHRSQIKGVERIL